MGGRELDQHVLGDTVTDPDLLRRAAVHIADRIAAQHPTDLDDLAPEYAGRLLAQDPTIRAGLRELLAAIGHPARRTP
jgi:hypothetical protein